MNQELEQSLQEFQKSPEKIKSQVKQILKELEGKIPSNLGVEDVKFSWENLGQRVLGRHAYRYNKITGKTWNHHLMFNSVFEGTSIPPETLSHELAHCLACRWKGYMESGHSFYWGYIMICLGYEPSRSCSQDSSIQFSQAKQISTMPQYKFELCPKCGVEQMLERENTHYKCPECGAII